MGVTLSISLSDNGLFSKAREATEKYKQAQSEEEESIRQIATQLYSEYVGAKVIGYTPKSDVSGCTVGTVTTGTDYDQTFHTDPKMGWRVWDFDGNTLRIIGDPTTETLELAGVAGYNNGVWAMDYICKELYSNDKEGVSVTNLKRSDIQKVSTYDYTKYKHIATSNDEYTDDRDDVENLIYFGETKTYTKGKNQYPKMWEENDKKWTYEYKDGKITGGDKGGTTWEVIGRGKGSMNADMNAENETTINFKQSYYQHDYKQNEFINSSYYDLIFKKSDGMDTGYYLLATRYTHLGESDKGCAFGIMCMYSGSELKSIRGGWRCNSLGDLNVEGAPSYSLRPVVSIDLDKSGCSIEKEENADRIENIRLIWNGGRIGLTLEFILFTKN